MRNTIILAIAGVIFMVPTALFTYCSFSARTWNIFIASLFCLGGMIFAVFEAIRETNRICKDRESDDRKGEENVVQNRG